MKVLIGCESSAATRDAFLRLGYDAYSCDLLESAGDNSRHFRCDLREAVFFEKWDLLIAHPTCTYLCSSGFHWNYKNVGRSLMTEYSLDFVRFLMELKIPRIAIENPIGCISSRIRKPDQIIQPHQFGHDASKATCLWLKGLPKLRGTKSIPPRFVDGKPRWANQTDSGQNKLPPSGDRWRMRSETYQGIADAFADQWTAGGLL